MGRDGPLWQEYRAVCALFDRLAAERPCDVDALVSAAARLADLRAELGLPEALARRWATLSS